MSECLRRVTNNYEAMIDLLKYGLIRTSIEKVAELASEETGVVLTKELLRSSKVKRYVSLLYSVILNLVGYLKIWLLGPIVCNAE